MNIMTLNCMYKSEIKICSDQSLVGTIAQQGANLCPCLRFVSWPILYSRKDSSVRSYKLEKIV